MNDLFTKENLRILVIEDNRAIHEDFRKILCQDDGASNGLTAVEREIFDAPINVPKRLLFEVDSAYQGQEGLVLVQQAVRTGCPYALAFVDVRMPPGWDGMETVEQLWTVCPDLQIVICTAYSDYSWDEMSARLKNSDQLLILKKPFDSIEILQLANALTKKWHLHQEARLQLDTLEKLVRARTQALQTTNLALEAEIRERQRATEERNIAEERIHEQAALLDLAPDAIFVRDLTGAIRFWNHGAEKLYGWKSSEVLGCNTNEIFPANAKLPLTDIEAILLEKGEWSGELRKFNRGGQEVVIDSRWTLLRDKTGKPRSVLVISTDITEKKKLEVQFLRSQRMEGIGTLATGMAHDLNNILAPILISAGLMRSEILPEERELAICRIEGSVRRGAEIIQQVLTFGRGASGERMPVNAGEVIHDLSKIIGQTFSKDVIIKVNINAALWPVIGDKTQIHQVLLNLCINSRDAMSKGGILGLQAENFMIDESFAATHPPLHPGPHVLLQISDTGTGIPEAHREKIFDPFFTTKEIGKGTGLGLSTALGIIKSHHGLITLQSELNQGTTVKVFLPASSEVAKTSRSHEPDALPHGDGEKILFVDDEVNIVAASRRMLEHYGYQVCVASQGREALKLFLQEDQNIDLVITDIMMPDVDGIDLINALRKIDPAIKIIAASGLSRHLVSGIQSEKLESMGVKFFLAKPYTAEKLLTSLRELLQGELEVTCEIK